MRKSFWLVSAGVLALASPAYAQPAEDEVSPTAQSGAVDDTGIAQTETAVRDDGDIIVTATRRNQALKEKLLYVPL